ncbi:hypothetical protein [Roseibium sp. RKSG952]|uniref:hypothetical protein n=1 Tax=Roseibium sp. RKSG952 TaxID=2529384 RepID=UPI0012BCFE08|nr:hypothetical protein [Roseibium sp. RKSG952]MTH94633.1 hypothetical protein [Roseibium sp. RKSG952]
MDELSPGPRAKERIRVVNSCSEKEYLITEKKVDWIVVFNTLSLPSKNSHGSIPEVDMQGKSKLRQTSIKDRIQIARENNRSVPHLIFGLPKDLLEEALPLLHLPERIRYERLLKRQAEKRRKIKVDEEIANAAAAKRRAKENGRDDDRVGFNAKELEVDANNVVDFMTYLNR